MPLPLLEEGESEGVCVRARRRVETSNGVSTGKNGATRQDTPADDNALTFIYAQEEDASPVSDTLQELPSHVARGLLYLVLLFLSIALVWASTNTIDVITSARAIMIPEGKEKLIHPSMPGVLHAIYVREGESVKKGQELIELEAEDVSKSLADLRAAETDLSLARKELYDTIPQKISIIDNNTANEREKFAFKQDIYNILLAKVQEKTARTELDMKNALSALALVIKEKEVNERLGKLGLVAEIKVFEVQRTHEEAEFRIENVRSLLRDARKERELLERDFAVSRKQYEMLLRDLAEQRQRLQREAEERYTVVALRHKQAEELAHLNLRGVSRDVVEQAARGEGKATNRTVIRAPDDGIITQLAARNPGEAVSRGQTLMMLIPSDATLLAELTVLNKDMGTLRPGQPVKLKFDAFSYAEYGAITGSIVRIAPDAQVDSTGNASYRVLTALQQTYFRVKDTKVLLLPGMTASAEIVTDQKTILELLFKPLAEFAKTKEAEK